MPEPARSIGMVKTAKQPAKNLAAHRPVEKLIHVIRGQKVMLDRDLAALYEVPTKALNQAVRRNIGRFPEDFAFLLSKDELGNWRSQIVTSNSSAKMGLRRPPYAFTQEGVAMLSAVLHSDRGRPDEHRYHPYVYPHARTYRSQQRHCRSRREPRNAVTTARPPSLRFSSRISTAWPTRCRK